MGTLGCLFNRELMAEKIEASFELVCVCVCVRGAAGIFNLVSGSSAVGSLVAVGR